MPLNDTERDILKECAENAYKSLERAAKWLSEAEAEHRKAQAKHVEAVRKWQALSRHFDPENA